jgi:hypothetical protein
MRMGFGLLGARLGIAFDSDDGQNDDRCRFIRRISTEAHNASFVRELNNVAHQPLSSAAGTEAFCPDARKLASPRLSGMQG